jgi:2-polyprenyl-3-methyl-5-hydroxy-6-metoxy-1,4-benzoquinol methylase
MLPDGYPPLSIYKQITNESTYVAMENFSDKFLQSNATILENYAQRGTGDPLHTWSRGWEYMFVYERLTQMAQMQSCDIVKILDAGSGLTFFPHFVATMHPNVSIQCFDRDPQLKISGEKLMDSRASAVSYSVQDISALTYTGASFDVIYSISVLEHCDYNNYVEILEGFVGILKPGGRLLLTVDISLDGRSEITRYQCSKLIEHLEQCFVPDSEYAIMVDMFNESEILTTAYARKVDQSLLPWQSPRWHQSLRHLVRHGRRPIVPFMHLTCFCMGWTLSSTSDSQ